MDLIKIRGAREHNLKSLDLDIPRNRLVVITGVSGSGKSSLAFDTLYAEGQRRYVESLSAYARQFLGQMEKPDVDQIEGLSPAISIEQRTAGTNPRSTVATVTEIYDYLRLLYARIGVQHCVECGRPIRRQTVQEMVDHLLAAYRGRRLQILAPVVRGRKGEYRKEIAQWRRLGYVRARVDGGWVELEEEIALDKKRKHTIEIVVDRLPADTERRSRLHEALETATRLAEGLALALVDGDEEETLSSSAACPACGISYEPLQPRSFSFNSPYGACKTCDGLGTTMEIDPDLVVPDRAKSLREGAIPMWGDAEGTWTKGTLKAVAKRLKISLDTPFGKLPASAKNALLSGLGDEKLEYAFRLKDGRTLSHTGKFRGILNELQRRYRETTSDAVREQIGALMTKKPCPACGGARLKPESLAVKVDGLSIAEWTGRPVTRALEAMRGMTLSPRDAGIAAPVLKELRQRLEFLDDVGVGYLTLDRAAGTLSGGEAQRIRLATQIGSRLTGVLYILDEPSIGLHPVDNKKLLETLLALRDLGNSVLVVEHDRETMDAADHIVDLGPGAGRRGGYLVAEGTVEEVRAVPGSLTGQYLSGAREIPIPAERRAGSGAALEVVGARQNNLRGIRARFPLGTLVCVTGVSGSGKSTLVNDILYKALARRFYQAKEPPGAHEKILGLEHVDKVVAIDQSPIGRTPRSNPATYTGLFTFIRDLFAATPEAKVRGYGPGRFSFNVKGGRCEACGGDGLCTIEMHFLPDVYVTCEVCRGKRYNRETLEVTYKGRSIADVLEMTVEDALELLGAVPPIRRKLETLAGVGLGYIHLGQAATTLSGGEAQRVKLASELSRVETGRTLYLLDEPTTGLHFEDVRQLLDVLDRLVDRGNTVIVIEHNGDVMARADWILDLGPGGGEAGGRVVAEGTPEAVAANPESKTGEALREFFRSQGRAVEAPSGRVRRRREAVV
ncbi:MAG TPA: excinuclease ABC subunit UvrA [Candidatus Eisenbacteria bacterium]|nr:excinuclease ABC subunit UvrA [Candidatus Eisenbacteria bacterium]